MNKIYSVSVYCLKPLMLEKNIKKIIEHILSMYSMIIIS